MTLGVHLQIVLAVVLAVLCYSLVVVCILCCRRKKKSISSLDKEAVLLSPYPPTVTLTPSQFAHPIIKQQYEELDGDVLDFPLSKSSSSPSEDDLCALPSDISPTRSPGLLLSPRVSVPVRRLSSPVLSNPSNKSPVHGRASLPSINKLTLMSRSKRAKDRRSTVSGESFLGSEGSSLNSDPQLKDGAQYGAMSGGSKPTPLLHFSLLFSSAYGTLMVNILGVSGTSRKKSSVFVRASLPPLCPAPQLLPSRRRSFSPELHSQSTVLQVGPIEELRLCTLTLAVYSRDFSGLREAMVGLVEMPCEQMDLTPDTTCTFTREINPTKCKLKKSVSSQETLAHRKTSVCVPKVLGQVFLLLQYQSLAQRIKLMVRKADDLAKLTKIPGTPDHYVVINMRLDGKVIATKETKGASGLSPVWNAPFLFDLPPGDVTELPLLFEFIIMQGRLYTKSSVLGRVLIGSSASEEGRSHWKEVLSRGQIETARWHSIQPDVL